MKPVLTGLVGAFLIFYVITSPDTSADIVHKAWESVVDIAHGAGDFVDELAS